MKKSSVLGLIGTLSLFFALLHVVALRFSIYWTVPYSDSFMHLFGGLIGALLVLYIISILGLAPVSIPKKAFLLVFVTMCVFSVAVVWELWEIYVGFNDPFEADWLSDTILDLVMGVCGAVIGFFYFDTKLKKHAE